MAAADGEFGPDVLLGDPEGGYEAAAYAARDHDGEVRGRLRGRLATSVPPLPLPPFDAGLRQARQFIVGGS